MAYNEYLEAPAWVKGERTGWSPAAKVIKVILGVILSALVLSPAILGLYWELLLP